MHRTGITHGAAVSHTAWMKWAATHPAVHAALAAEQISASYAQVICGWTGKLPEAARPAADDILLGAAGSGLELEDLAGLAGEMSERSRQGKPDADPGDEAGEPDAVGEDGKDRDGPGQEQDRLQDDRSVKLATTIGGAGWIRGDLTPECAEFVRTVLDSLSAPAGADDDRSHEQRYHDGLQEAMRRLIAAGLVPQRAGQAVSVLAYMSLADLMLIEGSSALLAEWTSELRARWARHRAAAGEAGGHQGLWLDGAAAQALACDASVTPVVVGDVNLSAFDALVRLCAELGTFSHGTGGSRPGDDEPDDSGAPGAGVPGTDRSRDALVQAISSQPASACEVHHVRHKADGGPTSLTGCVLLCHFHHQVMIHRRGWTLVVNPDGTTTAWDKDRTRVLHSHGPPARAG